MASTSYPLLRARRRRRRHRHRRRLPSIGLREIAFAVLTIAAIGIAVLAYKSRVAPLPRQSFAAAVKALDHGNYSAARNDAMVAVAGDPASAAAHLLLARAYLLLDDGIAAEAELERSGIAADRLGGARSRALFLQGNLDDALAEAEAAPATDRLAVRTRARILAVQGQRGAAEALLGNLIAAHPEDAAAEVDLGRLRLDAGDIGGAAAAAAQAVRLAPADPQALTLQGEVVRIRFGLVAALPWFTAALQSDAYYHPALIEDAATLGDLGRYTDMLAATRKALAAKPNSPQALYLQAVLAARAGKSGLARMLFERAGPIDRSIAGAMLVSGAIDARDGRSEQAIGDARRLVDAQPMNLSARRLLAGALLRSGDAQGALELLSPMIVRSDADTYTLTLAARAAEAGGDRVRAGALLDRAGFGARQPSDAFAIDASRASFEQAAALAPDDSAAAIAVIRARIATGDAASGIDRATALAAGAPGDPHIQRALGDALAAAGRGGDAVAAYTRAADLAFDEPTMLRLIDTLGRTGRTQEAAATLALYLQQNPQSVVAQQLRAHWQVASGEGAKAVPVLEALRRVTGTRNIMLLTDLTLAHIAKGEAKVARRFAQAGYGLAPLDPAMVDAYGLALAADKDMVGARQLFAKATLLDPRNPVIRAHMTQALR
jgi:Flp pilus assembly protein TadD